ncbi:MAG: hypothetical protein COT16_01670 [Elusimicrobia bacterium CG08_land_8_20_14_0_20_44_26]|nr:MAG: hypothetical protein COT16_01670 [Elusimicrobia bacterium CG08_land_8_20_14_0_20_44_26]
MNFIEYYRNPVVRRRIADYCGGDWRDPSSFTAQYLVGYGVELLKKKNIEFESKEKEYFEWILENGLDIYRSVWDIESTLAVLDIEYFNIDYPGEIYKKPNETFPLIEPAYRKILEVFARFGIKPLTIMTGQGYHFTFKISRFSFADKILERCGFVSDSLKNSYKTVKGRRKRPVSIRHGRAFEGMGKILEFIVQTVIRELGQENFQLPCVITDVAVGPSRRGHREALSFDLSMYGDPIFMRDIRCPFSTHQKHKMQWYKVGKDIAEDIPPRLAIPRNGITLEEALKIRISPEKTIELAKKVSCKIPDFSKEFPKLYKEYQSSKLYKLHKSFDREKIDDPSDWPKTYDALDTETLPVCTRLCILLPNNNLLRPTNLQNLVRVLLYKGWHPKHIAGLVYSKYVREQYNWTENWQKYNPSSRANFYVRIFSDLILAGIDKEVDMNCVSANEIGFCVKEWCGWNLSDFKLKECM